MTDLTKAAQAALDAHEIACSAFSVAAPYLPTVCKDEFQFYASWGHVKRSADQLRAALAAQQTTDLIPQDALFVCPQIGNSVTRVTQQPVAEIRVENDYWNRGHFFEGTRPALFALADLSKYPLGTKLFAV